ncbi:MAG: transporter substrate-binding domain-containing protein [Alphaproteobacteria bacterium]|nr:transporter substrate-binding domain-containing protein [Alphaproteobacteria bacterium]
MWMQRCAALALAAAVAQAACAIGGANAQTPACEPDKVAQKYPDYAGKTVKVAATPTYPPFTYTDPKDPKRLVGLESEIAEDVLVCAGLKFEYVLGAWSGLLPSLFSGASDIMVGNVNYRPDRAEKADFVVFMRNGTSVIVQKGNPKKIVDTDTLCGASASANTGGSSSLEIERLSKVCVGKGKPAINLQQAADQEAAYRLLLNERIDFVMDGASSAAARMAAAPDFTIAFTMLTENVAGPVVAKGNATMLRVIADGLKIMEQNGKLKALMSKYGMAEELLIPVAIRN